MEPLEPIQLVEEPAEEPIFGGHDFAFVDELSPGQICSICLVAMRNPVQTSCGHRFCEECLVGTFGQGNGRVCPQDRNPIPDTMGFFHDVAWETEILSLRVMCTMSDRGCTWIGALWYYEEHYDSCLYEDVVCEDCKEEMQRRFLEDHMALECQNRIVQCEHCKEQFEFWRTQAHEGEECIRFPLECPQQCGVQEIPREEVEVHVRDDCLMTPVACPYEGAGCAFNDKRMNLKAHIEESTEDHLEKTWKELIKTNGEIRRVNELEQHVDEMQGRVQQLELKNEAMDTSLQRKSKEINDLKLSEQKLEVENLSLKQDMTELRRRIAEIQSRLETMETKGDGNEVAAFTLKEEAHKGEKCIGFSLDCSQPRGVQEIPRRKYWPVSEPFSAVPLKECGRQSYFGELRKRDEDNGTKSDQDMTELRRPSRIAEIQRRLETMETKGDRNEVAAFTLKEEAHKGEECIGFSLDCSQPRGVQEIPRRKYWPVSEPFSAVPLQDCGRQSYFGELRKRDEEIGTKSDQDESDVFSRRKHMISSQRKRPTA